MSIRTRTKKVKKGAEGECGHRALAGLPGRIAEWERLNMSSVSSTVYLVGAGPGDPDLLTVRAARLLDQAEVVVYDRLVSAGILDLIPPGRARIFVGKAAGRHHMPQDEINDLLVSLAKTNRSVVRLKGGDPFVFGRGSEEALYLARHRIKFEIVPGITAAQAIGATTGIPLTHRGLATGLRYVTGHCRADVELDLDWDSLADPDTTLVLYMARANLVQISDRLTAAGLSPETPAAAVSGGTLSGQRQCIGTLASIPSMVEDLDLPSPVLIMVGRVVTLAERLNWQNLDYEEAPPDQDDDRLALA